MKFPAYLTFKDYVFTINGYMDDTTIYINGKGYVERSTGDIWICKDKLPKKSDYPVFSIKEGDNEFKIVKEFRGKSETMNTFNIKSLEDLSTEKIVANSSEDDVLYDEAALHDMNSSNGLFIPTVEAKDDFLKKIVKTIIIAKEIDVKRLQHRFPEKHGLPNLISALKGKTKMSTTNFLMWAELLGIDFNILVNDNGSDEINPLPKNVTYVSINDKIVAEE